MIIVLILCFVTFACGQVVIPSNQVVIPQQALVSCPALIAPTNGFIFNCINAAGYTCSFGDCATVAELLQLTISCPVLPGCNAGFLLVGSPTLLCQVSGAWTGPPPVCNMIATTAAPTPAPTTLPPACPALTTPANGVATGTCGANSPAGATCSFSCNTGD